jgi:Tfp pilus assembly protein PilV
MNESRMKDQKLARRGSSEKGFSILETVIALVIMMVIGFGAISLFLFSISYNAGASDRAHAHALAQQRIETLRSASYASLTAATATANTGPVSVGSALAGDSDRRTFNVTTTIADVAGATNSRLKLITVTVTPASAGRWSSGSVTLKLYRASITVG